MTPRHQVLGGQGHTMFLAPGWIAKLVNISPITMVYGTEITIVTGANLNQLITGGAHCSKHPIENPPSVDGCEILHQLINDLH